MKPVMAICSIMLVTTPAAGFAQDRSYPDFGSVAPENGPVSAGRPVATRGGPDAAVERTRQEVKMLDDLFQERNRQTALCHANFKGNKGNVGALAYTVPVIE
jgi:hypothetical protein